MSVADLRHWHRSAPSCFASERARRDSGAIAFGSALLILSVASEGSLRYQVPLPTTMFKSVEIGTRYEHILLRVTRAEVEALRKVALADRLLCPECETPVRVKAGEIKTWHFAHSVRKDCPLQNEPAARLQARALLFDWLASKFPDHVALEVKPEGATLPHPIDCVVTTDKGVTFGFWIVEKPIRSAEKRREIQAGMQKLGIARWVLLSNILRANPSDPTQLFLSTTERELITPTPYDTIYSEATLEGSLHYLDVESGTLTTYRSLRKLHGEHGYHGHGLTDALSSMLITPKGELIHPGEFERKQTWIEQRKAIRKLVGEEEAYWAAKRNQEGNVVEEQSDTMPPLAEVSFVCTGCGGTFGLRDVSQADFGVGTCLCRACAGLPVRRPDL